MRSTTTNRMVTQDPASWGHAARLRRVLTEEQTATYLTLSPRTLQRMRAEGGGPPFVRMGGRIGYAIDDLDAWVAQRRSSDTTGYFHRADGSVR